ncbi:division/cell wall cluster transcriptional repressor MraZ [Saccharicrinis aurantiacus]|uniref:division/cell wall cluster transcriptional repressor MraZ n=1 Tax=Saccharicrinis aurantiacus TaxID=1849719 RepID=UPI00094F732C|nr:cell division protein MraZ [Saccharicrinis aurantiacus]
MSTFIGDFVSKIDTKGRVVLPSVFKKAMVALNVERFVVRKDLFEPCLVLMPYSEWELEMEDIRSRINLYNRTENKFYRQYFRGAAEINLDANGRMLIPKRLLEKIECPKELVMVGVDMKIELWSKETYEKDEMSEEDLAKMAETILGSKSNFEG